MTDLQSLEFVRLGEVAPDTFNVLLFGAPKSGKSTAAATAPGPIMWLNCEGAGALGFARKVAAERGNQILEVAMADGKNGRQISPMLHMVMDHLRQHPEIRSVVVDTIGKVREALAHELVQQGSPKSIQQWGKVNDILTGFVRGLRDLPVNVVFLAHLDQVDDAEAGRSVRPLIGGKATEVVPGEVDVVAFTSPHQVDGQVRYVGQLVDGNGRTGLGDRSGGIRGELTYRELDLTEWLARYREALTPQDDPFTPEASAELDLEAATA
jgi:hypothetical protein